jgi:hypothetical protein
MTTEPVIIINGHRLTPAQALTVRCALDAFGTVLQTIGLPGEPAQSERMKQAYLARLAELHALIGAQATPALAEEGQHAGREAPIRL